MRSFLILAAAALLCSCAGRNRYTVEGTVAGDDRTLYLCVAGSVCDSAQTEKGSFRLRGTTKMPQIAMLCDAPDGTGALHTIVFLEQGQIAIVPDSTDEMRYFATGTPANDAFRQFSASQVALIEEYRNPATSDDRRRQIAREELSGLARRMMQENRDNLFGAIMLEEATYYGLSGEELLGEISRFSPEMQQTELLLDLKRQAEQQLQTAASGS